MHTRMIGRHSAKLRVTKSFAPKVNTGQNYLGRGIRIRTWCSNGKPNKRNGSYLYVSEYKQSAEYILGAFGEDAAFFLMVLITAWMDRGEVKFRQYGTHLQEYVCQYHLELANKSQTTSITTTILCARDYKSSKSSKNP